MENVLQENMLEQWDLAHRLIESNMNSDKADEALMGRALQLAVGDLKRGEPLPRRVFHLMRNMKEV